MDTMNVKFLESLQVRIIESPDGTITGSAAPTTTPKKVGQVFIDTVAKKCYMAVGTSGAGDWKILN